MTQRKYPVYLTAAEIAEVLGCLGQVDAEYGLVVGLHTPECPTGQGGICYQGTHSQEEVTAAYERGDALRAYFERLASYVDVEEG